MPPNLLRRIPSSLKLLLTKSPAEPTPLSLLPEDILLETARHLPPVDLLSLALTSTRFLWMFLPTLYSAVDLRCSAHCQHTLKFLLTHPHIARCIKSLVVRPNNEEWAQTAPEASMREIESWVVVTIDQMAMHLVNLKTFIWDGREFPKYDNVWQSLRTSCPELRHVGVTVGLGDFTFRSRKVMPTNSTLFQFNDLLGFTLRVKQLVGSGLHPPFDELPQTFWDMLLTRCPNLQHLTIDTVNERYIDVRPLFQGRWPSLRHLTLGDFVLLDAFATVDPQVTNNGMSNFLSQHQALEEVVLHQLEGWYFPLSLSLPPAALPNLQHFSARFLMIRHIPNVLCLESLELMNHPHGMYRMAGALWAISQLPALSSLRIWIDCHDSGDADVKSEHMKYFADILAAAPRLRHLDISCSTDPTFPMTELSTALSRTRGLRSLVVTQVKTVSREGDMLKDAMMLFRENSTLKHLKLQDAVARWRQLSDLRFQKVATFELLAGSVLTQQEIGFNRRGSQTYMNSTPSSERTVYFDMSPAPTPTAEVPPLAPLPNTTQPDPALAPLHAPVPVAGQAAPAHETPARINSVSPAMPEPQTEAELAEARDTVDPNDMPQPSRISPTSTPPPNGHARSASVGRAPSIGRASVFTNTDGQTVGGSTFINGAGTTGPSASVERNESLHQRAASADATFSEQQKARITKNGSKSNKQLAKIIKTEAKVEKKALNLALKELGELQKIQKTAVKREAKAQSAYTHTLSAFQKHEAAFLAARAKYEASQSLLTSTTETLEVSRNNAKEATASLQEKSTEVDGLRQIFDVDEREREVKMVELTGKPTTKSRWSIMG